MAPATKVNVAVADNPHCYSRSRDIGHSEAMSLLFSWYVATLRIPANYPRLYMLTGDAIDSQISASYLGIRCTRPILASGMINTEQYSTRASFCAPHDLQCSLGKWITTIAAHRCRRAASIVA